MVKYKTTINDGHRHTYTEGNKFTSFDDGHNHRVINNTRVTAGKKNGHKHNLIKIKK